MSKGLFPLLAVAAAVGVFFVYIDPTYEEVKVLQEEVGRIDEALDTARELAVRRDELLARAAALPETDVSRLEKLLPDHVDNVRLIIDLSSVASRHGMSISNLRVGDSGGGRGRGDAPDRIGDQGASPLGAIDVSFSTSGPYQTFLAFLRDLEESLRIIDVVSLTFESGGINSYDYNLTIRTYWLR